MAKKRQWIKITEDNSFYHQFGDNTAIFGVDPEPRELRLSLSEKEFKTLMIGMGMYSEAREDLALCYFVRTICISEWHKRIIRHTFKGSLGTIKIELL